MVLESVERTGKVYFQTLNRASQTILPFTSPYATLCNSERGTVSTFSYSA